MSPHHALIIVRSQGRFALPDLQLYRDFHETSLTLAVLGGVIGAGAAVELAWSRAGVFFDWPIAVGLAIAFAALWLTFWRRAASRGMQRPPGFGIAAIIGLAAILPPFVVVVLYAGPFISFGIGLAVACMKLRNRVLTSWALGVGAIGVFEGFFGITNRLPLGIWAAWEHAAIYLRLGAITLLAGIIIRIRVRNEAR